MRDIKWYADASARQMHALLQTELAGIIARICPGHELSHLGINRNEHTEVILKLHLNPIGSVRVVPEHNQDTAAILLPK
jgi:hypothetical protein